MSGVPAAALSAFAFSAALVRLGDPRESALVWAAGLTAWGLLVAGLLGLGRRSSAEPMAPGRALVRLALVAVLVRVPLLAAPPTLSDDVYRYIWEGRVWLAGYSPFAHPPDDPALAAIRDPLWMSVNHREVSSIYPPLAQALFVLLAGGGVGAWRLAMSACDVATACVLAGRDARAGWAWALLPLPAVESAVSGHLEGVGALLVALALGGSDLAAWLGALLKLLPAVLLVHRPPRVWALAALGTLLATLPLLGPGLTRGFETYRAIWAFNGSLHPLVTWCLGDDALARSGLQALAAAAVAWILWRSRDAERIALWTFGTFVALSPTVHPWYALWPLVPALLLGTRAWVLLAVAMPLAYVVLAGYDAATSRWAEAGWVRPAIYLPFYALLIADAWRARRRANSGRVD
jgi:hypothetical protein